MTPLTFLWASVVAFVAGFWLGGLVLIWLIDRHNCRHAYATGAETNGATRVPPRVAPHNRSEPWGAR